jgi:hypothetical protein
MSAESPPVRGQDLEYSIEATAMGIENFPTTDHPLSITDPLIEALQIDDRRSDYCEKLEAKIAEQNRALKVLRRMVGFKRLRVN